MTGAVARDDWRRGHLRHTLLNAAPLPFYRAHWGAQLQEAIVNSRGAIDTAIIPVFGKENYVCNLQHFRQAAGDPSSMWANHTKGTTGAPLPRFRPVSEVRYLQSFLSSLYSQSAHSTQAILTTDEWRQAHGSAVGIRVSRIVQTVGSMHKGSTPAWVEAISRWKADHGASTSVGSLYMGLASLLSATYAMESARWPPHSVNLIVTVGGYVAPALQQSLEQAWGATLVDRYSVSEVIGGASQCKLCSWYHPDPYVVYEMVNPVDPSVPASSGVGLLVVTELWPLSRANPFVRYSTGDLVEIGPRSCARDFTAFRFVGREIRRATTEGQHVEMATQELSDLEMPLTPAGRPIFRPTSAINALVGIPGLLRKDIVGTEGDPHGYGQPRVTWSLYDDSRLRIRLIMSSGLGGELDELECMRILRKDQPELNALIAAGELHFEVDIGTAEA